MKQSVENSSSYGLITEDFTPIYEAFIGGQDDACLFISASNEPEEKAGLSLIHSSLLANEQINGYRI